MSSPLKVGPQVPYLEELGVGQHMKEFAGRPKPALFLSV